MIKILFKNKKFQILSLLIFLLIDFYLDVERKATILTFIFFVLVLINSNMFQKHIDLIYKERSLKNVYVFIYLMLITFLTQNYLLIYEIIDWDISSYMITSNSVMNGSLPYEVQWESKGPLLYYLYGSLTFQKSGLRPELCTPSQGECKVWGLSGAPHECLQGGPRQRTCRGSQNNGNATTGALGPSSGGAQGNSPLKSDRILSTLN